MKVRPVPFPEKNGAVPFNASGVVRVGSRHFVFVDNKDPGSLFELTFDPRITTVERIHRRRLAGLGRTALRDPEGLTRADVAGETFLVVASSLCAGNGDRVSDGLVRVRYRRDGDLPAEPMDGFRAWFLARLPQFAAAGRLVPDAGGLNVEGLAWDAGTLLFGLRGPATPGEATVVRVPADVGAARWTTAVLGAPEVVALPLPDPAVPWGIRDLAGAGRAGDLLVLLGRSASDGDAPFRLGTWHPGRGRVELLDVAFHRTAKPEGVTAFTVDGEERLLVVDDAGGYAVL
ncbi:DUF3616 domain-containing protein [Amycolatopsis vancoresmycina]|uniref:DUF3616 domain-containing protein n=1 Tax=Amycolatopsis vancoresmycina TaxID=208444 RepID=UPI0005242F1E|nr:DUF3616 domain-containing protein [Amycolatopsis vancoresmycina]